MSTFKRFLLVLFVSLCAFVVHAAPTTEEEPVTIEQGDKNNDETIVVKVSKDNGFVYATKVTTKRGSSYYLVRADGTQADFIRTDQPKMLVPSWQILSW